MHYEDKIRRMSDAELKCWEFEDLKTLKAWEPISLEEAQKQLARGCAMNVITPLAVLEAQARRIVALARKYPNWGRRWNVRARQFNRSHINRFTNGYDADYLQKCKDGNL